MSLHIDTAACDDTVTLWMRHRDDASSCRVNAIARYDALRLDDVAIGFPTTFDEVAEEIGAACRVLASTAAAARAADEFDGDLDELDESAVVAATLLTQSMNDGKGANLADVEDPDPANDDDDLVTVHLGYLPLWGEEGPLPDDVAQGSLSDCALVATFAGIAIADPSIIERTISANGDGTYTVTFPDGMIVLVDDECLSADGRPEYARSQGVLWPLILEKAIVVRRGGDYDDVEGDFAAETMAAFAFLSFGYALNPGTIIPRRDPADSTVAADMSTALEAGLPVTARARGDSFGVAGGSDYHMWTVVSVEDVDGVTMVTVRNPWGFPGMRLEGDTWVYHAPDNEEFDGEVPFAEDGDGQRLTLDADTGYLTMPIDMFTDNFDGIEVATVATVAD